MEVIKGKSVFGGIVIGKIAFYKKSNEKIKRYKVDKPEEEVTRFDNAKQTALLQLDELYKKALTEVGEANAAIVQVHQMMIEDLDYLDSIKNIILTQGVNAEYAVGVTGDNFSQMFSTMEDEYMKERAADVLDISNRIVRVLNKEEDGRFKLTEPVIIAADDLAPSETIQLDKNMVLSFITRQGSTNSHTAILARTMNIPAVIGIGEELKQEYDGKYAIIDGFTGTIYIEPEENVLKEMEVKKKQDEEKKILLQKLRGQENITIDGKKINIYANIGNSTDIGAVLKNDAGGIGLFRSEFLYLEKDTFPTEDEQFAIYKYVAESMAGKKVIIRTLDIGADKQVGYFDLPLEENPALGYRAIRICLTVKDIFKTQLRALYRASAYGNIAIMFPMITSLEEVKEIKEIIQEVKAELAETGIDFKDNLELGIMIETPAAVMISDLLAKEVDFFSIGTNDLTQYTLAIDRQNPKLDKFYNPHHPAILRMIQLTADNAHKNGKWIGICGELAGDLSLTETFLKMGIDELSVSPGLVLGLRNKVRESDVSKILKNW
ncbi:phosphoenolpyruvate--protein phosphotransferase [Anaerocolumna sedimenticola]|uniref:Phosphoenolpyruvate-protein phosphotransferase n=1 Tax=Anaerocolumna sedimenticola TaxID=2696063 RepID=A0A6P1TDU3_9FIRM|nr:phosphoenolpyruvate--protein phosphotransferase [Anaerocolumna sedimenticola]QHQ59400.1 phosphoenolpyruvate--protein phosphotransferase [Anaerocolumna sedimenticola]